MKASGMRACYILEQEKRVFYKNNFHARTHKSVDGPKTFTLKNYFSFYEEYNFKSRADLDIKLDVMWR